MDALTVAFISAGAGCAGALTAILSVYFARAGFRASISDRTSKAEATANAALKAVAELDNDVRDSALKLESDIRELHSRTSATLANVNLLRETVARDFVSADTLRDMEKRIVDGGRHSEHTIATSINHMTERLDRFILAKLGADNAE